MELLKKKKSYGYNITLRSETCVCTRLHMQILDYPEKNLGDAKHSSLFHLTVSDEKKILLIDT